MSAYLCVVASGYNAQKMIAMEQGTGSGNEDAVLVQSSSKTIDTPAKEASDALRQLRAGSTSLLATTSFGTDGAQDPSNEGVIDPGDMQYEEDLHGPSSSTVVVNPVTDFTARGRRKSDFDQYQKHIYTPRSTRSMTQPSRSYHTEDELEEDPMAEPALSVEEPDIPRIQAFAKLEFDDGEFYMNTYSVELGRDLHSARQAADKLPVRRTTVKRRRSASSGDASHIQRKFKRRNNRSHPSSVVSESGGVIAVDHSDEDPFSTGHVKKATSTSSSSQQMSRKSSMLYTPNPSQTDYQGLAMASLGLMGPNAPHSLGGSDPPVPAPDACPLIPIHPPVIRQSLTEAIAGASEDADVGHTGGTVGSHKAISRKHVKIAYNFEKNLFEVLILGRNGAYIDDEYCPCGDTRPLTNGTSMQIGGVSVRFLLPDVGPGETGADLNGNGSSISVDLEERSSIGSSEDEQDHRDEASEDEEDSDTGKTSHERSPEHTTPKKSRTKAKPQARGGKQGKPVRKVAQPDAIEAAPKRKGAGRTHKDGVMSKRERGILAKQAREEAKAAAQKITNGEPTPGKAKIGKVNTEKDLATPSIQPNGKRKYTKRKPKVDPVQEPQETRESTEHTESVVPEQIEPPKVLKEKKPPKPPRSPSPFIDRNSLTEEQLAKPPQSYVVLIYEALTESQKGPMSLNQIYRAIAHKYPYFKFVVTTVGWQSSIRHNLLQHEAFEKVEREGKGWMWGLKPGVSIEKEKKRRPTPPPMPQYFPHNMPNSYGHYPPIPPPVHGQNPYHPSYGPPPHGLPSIYHGMPPGYYPPPPRPNGLPLPLINAATNNDSTYKSPYATDSQQDSHRQGTAQESAPGAHDPTNAPQLSSSTLYAPLTQPSNTPHQPPTSQPQHHPQLHLSPARSQAVDRFKSTLLDKMKDKAFGEALINSAIARVFGSQRHSSLPGHSPDQLDDPQEVMVMKALRNMFNAVDVSEVESGPKVEEVKKEDETQHERVGAVNGTLTPGAVAKGLIDKDGAVKASPEANADAEANEDGGVQVEGEKESSERQPAAEVDDAVATVSKNPEGNAKELEVAATNEATAPTTLQEASAIHNMTNPEQRTAQTGS